MFQNIGTTEILIVVLVLVVIFGGNKVSEIAKGLGEATKEIKKAKKNVDLTKEELKKDPVIVDEKNVINSKPVKKNKRLQKN